MSESYYDPACLDLAELFLERPGYMANEAQRAKAKRLARAIQETVEAFLEDDAMADDAQDQRYARWKERDT